MLSAASLSGSDFLKAVGLAVAAIVALAITWMVFRRWWRRRYDGPEQVAEAWTLQQLRDLKVQGQITDAEFARLRSAMIPGSKGDEGMTPTKGRQGVGKDGLA